MDNQQLVVSKETFYDEDRELWYTYIGTTPPKRELFGKIYGKTKKKSRDSAAMVVALIQNNPAIND